MHETGGVWNGGAQRAVHAQQAHARTPTPSHPALPRRPSLPPANLTRQPGNFPGAPLVTLAPPPLRLRVLSRAALPSRLRRPSRAQGSSANPAVRRARSAGPGLPTRLLGLRGIRGRGRARCGQELRRLGCCRLAPPRGPVQSRHARKEGGREGKREERRRRRGEGQRGYCVEEQGAGFPKVGSPRAHPPRPNLYSRDKLSIGDSRSLHFIPHTLRSEAT